MVSQNKQSYCGGPSDFDQKSPVITVSESRAVRLSVTQQEQRRRRSRTTFLPSDIGFTIRVCKPA